MAKRKKAACQSCGGTGVDLSKAKEIETTFSGKRGLTTGYTFSLDKPLPKCVCRAALAGPKESDNG